MAPALGIIPISKPYSTPAINAVIISIIGNPQSQVWDNAF